MYPGTKLLGLAVALGLVAGPLILGLLGLVASRRTPAESDMTWNWRLTASSALLYTLAFNTTFFIQELFLVLPKALTPGLRPTLFHNNHTWQGDNPLVGLLQGTGALAIFLTGVSCALLLRRGTSRSGTVRLFVIWMTYNGLLQSLPQVIVGAVVPENDVGMAMNYLHFGTAAKMAMALTALTAIAVISSWLSVPLLSLAAEKARISTPKARTRFIFQVATLPALAAIPLIVLFRVPRNFIEVVIVPVVVTVVGIAWIQATAWRASKATPAANLSPISIAYPLCAVLILLLVFQILLQPGVHFY
jgi:hypothetical protein